MTQNDPAIAAVREARHRISAAHEHDPKRLIAYYQQLQESYKDRLLPAPEPMNGRSEAVTYPIPAEIDPVLAEKELEGFGESNEEGS